MRINKYIAEKKIASRREADRLIESGKVFINGKKANLGDQVTETDKIEVKTNKKNVYFAFYKPKGIISHSPKKGETDIKTFLGEKYKKLGLFPIGRLDKDSEGLIILTNDGTITEDVLSPDEKHEKEYIVETRDVLKDNFKAKIEKGVLIKDRYDKDYKTKPARIKILGPKQFNIVITEGKKRQIRKMVESLGNLVLNLKRVRIMDIRLSNLKSGEIREINWKK